MSGGRRAWVVYLLRCGDGSLYCGITNDLGRRVEAHESGRGGRFTRSRRPIELVWKKSRQSETAARRLEPMVKRLPRASKLALVAGDARLWRSLRRDLADG